MTVDRHFIDVLAGSFRNRCRAMQEWDCREWFMDLELS